jgi:aryl-alcohol dehydrogenase-like predicted oxidoreductase
MPNPHIALGLWPIAGITTVGVTAKDAEQTVNAAIESGITTFDTAFSYGYEGESDQILGTQIKGQRDNYTVIGKVGQRWNSHRERVIDGSGQSLIADAETSLRRMNLEYFDTLMLHSPDPNVALEKSAEAIVVLQQRGLCHQAGVCNIDTNQLVKFQSVLKCDAIQCPLNLMQRNSLTNLVPHCQESDVDVYTFWTLMKGLLAGKIRRDHKFAEGDSRPGYPIFQGAARERAHHIVDGMNRIGEEAELTTAQLAIGWVLSQPGISMALVGGHTPDQIRETALARPLSPLLCNAIDQLVVESVSMS